MKDENDNKTVDWVNPEFALEDVIVFVGGDNTEILTVQFVWEEAVWGGYCGEIYKNHEVRKATPEEIKAGKRLGDQP